VSKVFHGRILKIEIVEKMSFMKLILSFERWYDDMLEVEVRSKHYEDLKNLEEQKQAQRKFAEAVHKCYDDFIFCYSRRFTQEYRKSAEEASKILDEILKGDRKFVY